MSQCMFISQSATYPRHKCHFNSHQILPLLALLLHSHLGMTVQKNRVTWPIWTNPSLRSREVKPQVFFSNIQQWEHAYHSTSLYQQSCTFQSSKGNLFTILHLPNLFQVPSLTPALPHQPTWCLSAPKPAQLRHEEKGDACAMNRRDSSL